jgi:hypothetical protein
MAEVKLKVLVVDNGRSSGDLLRDSLVALKESVLSVQRANSLPAAVNLLSLDSFNTIFIDPLSLGLDDAAGFIFETREKYPAIVFVLYVDFSTVQSKKREFYAGARQRFKHYYTLDKATPATIFKDEVVAVVGSCRDYLRYSLKAHEIQELQIELQRIEEESSSGTAAVPLALLTEMRDQISLLKDRLAPAVSKVQEGTVFLSYRFVEDDYVEGLKTLLDKEGFKVITGENASGYISRSILERIELSEFFLCLMTRDKEKTDGSFTTSSWLLEEKGAALAMNKKIVLMVEEGVTDIGGLQGDWQRIHFTAKGFTRAALRAIDQLKTYVG